MYMNQLHVGAGIQVGPVTAFPVWAAGPTLSLAVPRRATVAVAELEEPEIGALTVTASGRLPVLLTEGTLLRGGWQTRVLARDAVVLPDESTTLETACVEAGRWGGERVHTVNGRVPVRVIGELRGVRRPESMRRDRGARQGHVWESIDRYQAQYGHRPTSSLADVMLDDVMLDGCEDEHPIRQRYRSIHDALLLLARSPLPGQSGIVIGIAGQPLFLELFSSASVFGRSLPSVVRGLAMDAATFPDEPTPARRARRFVERLMATPLEQQDEVPNGSIFGASVGYLDVRALDVRLPNHQGAAHMLAINSRHDLVLAA